MTSITKSKLQQLRPLIDQALAAIGKAQGVELKLGNATFDPELGTFSFKLNGKDAEGEAPEMLLLKRNAHYLNIDLAWLDKDLIDSAGKAYRLCGLKAGRGEAKCLARRLSDGQVFIFRARAFWTDERRVAEGLRQRNKSLAELRADAYAAAKE